MQELITDLAQDLLDCVVNRLILDEHPVCKACLVAGSERPPIDGCDCKCESGQGRAWIRVTQLEFAGLAGASGRELAKCPVGAWNATFEAGVERCIKDSDGKGKCENVTADAVTMHEDLASLIKGIECCAALEKRLWAPQLAQPVGPEGGCRAASYTFVVQIPKLFQTA